MPRQKQYREEDVIEKATQVFWRNGYNSASVRQLEEGMGINQFSIYSSFGSKKGVFLKALANYKEKVKEIFLSDLVHSTGDVDDIREFFLSFVYSVRSGKTPDGCLMANTAMELGTKDAEVKVQLKLFFEMLKDVFTDVLEKAKEKGNISVHTNVSKLANFLVGSTEGLAVTAKVLDDQQLDDFIEVTMESVK